MTLMLRALILVVVGIVVGVVIRPVHAQTESPIFKVGQRLTLTYVGDRFVESDTSPRSGVHSSSARTIRSCGSTRARPSLSPFDRRTRERVLRLSSPRSDIPANSCAAGARESPRRKTFHKHRAVATEQVDGFSISSRKGDKFGLRLVADGKVIKVK